MTTMRVHELPNIVWAPTPNKMSRGGARVERVVLHTWGMRLSDERTRYHDVVRYFKNPAPGGDPKRAVSSHFVYPGSAQPNTITQMVPYAEAAWTEAAYNRTSVEIECADAIWQSRDSAGLEQLAHIVGFLLHRYGLHPEWKKDGGFCRHGDLGVLGGSHPVCPTGNLDLFHTFAQHVAEHYHRGGYRHRWGR